ncbi:MAG: hypothetical protein ACK5LF_25635 [Bacteroides xylanisolvens]
MDLKIKTNVLIEILTIVLIASLSISLFSVYDYSDSLKRELFNRDRLIKQLNLKDSILQASFKTVNTIRNGNSSVDISELVRYSNSLTDENAELYKKINTLNDSVNYYKIYYNLNQYYFNHKYIITANASGGRSYSLERNAVRKDIYDKTQSKCYNAEREITNLRNEIDRYKRALKWYGIQIDAKNENNDIIYPSPYYAPKVDSALMLLEVYRDKLKYNKKNRSWKIGNRATFSISTIGISIKDTIVFRNPKPSSVTQSE